MESNRLHTESRIGRWRVWMFRNVTVDFREDLVDLGRLGLVTAQIVHDDDISGGKGGNVELLDVGPETDALIPPSNDAAS